MRCPKFIFIHFSDRGFVPVFRDGDISQILKANFEICGEGGDLRKVRLKDHVCVQPSITFRNRGVVDAVVSQRFRHDVIVGHPLNLERCAPEGRKRISGVVVKKKVKAFIRAPVPKSFIFDCTKDLF